MNDQIIKAARDCGMTTGDNQKHNSEYWWRSLGRPTNVRTSDLERFYAIAFKAGMERAAEICEAFQATLEPGMGECFSEEIRAHAQNQPESIHDTGNV